MTEGFGWCLKPIAMGTTLLLATLPFASALRAQDQQADLARKRLDQAVDGRVAGDPVRCIKVNEVRSTRIIDRLAIVYDTGPILYVNQPGSGADFLDRHDAMIRAEEDEQLCYLDIVRLVDGATRLPDGKIELGKFTPYTRPKK